MAVYLSFTCLSVPSRVAQDEVLVIFKTKDSCLILVGCDGFLWLLLPCLVSCVVVLACVLIVFRYLPVWVFLTCPSGPHRLRVDR